MVNLKFTKTDVKVGDKVYIEKSKMIFNHPWIISIDYGHLIRFFNIDEPLRRYEINIKEGKVAINGNANPQIL